jgi:hypothetical protein
MIKFPCGFGCCYHLVNVTSLTRPQNDQITVWIWLLLSFGIG